MKLNLAIERIEKGEYRIGMKIINEPEKTKTDWLMVLTKNEVKQLIKLGIKLTKSHEINGYKIYDIIAPTLEMAEKAWDEIIEPARLMELIKRS